VFADTRNPLIPPIRPDVAEMHRMSKAVEESGNLLSIDLLVVTRELEAVWEGRGQLRRLCLQLRPPPKDRTSQRRQNQTGSAK